MSAVDGGARDADHLVFGADENIAVRDLRQCRYGDATRLRERFRVHVNISAFVPPTSAPGGQLPGSVRHAGSVDGLGGRQVGGIQMLTFCSERALLVRPLVLSACL